MKGHRRISLYTLFPLCLFVYCRVHRSTCVLSFYYALPATTHRSSVDTFRFHNQSLSRICVHSKKRKSTRSIQSTRQILGGEKDVDDLVTGMGLHTVKSSSPKTNNSSPSVASPQKSPNDETTVPNFTPRETADIGLQTQLDYSRNGHAVLRNFVTPSMADVDDLRLSLSAYARSKELEAWKQKVQVASSSHVDKALDCGTIAECQDALKSLGVTASLPFLQYFNTWQSVAQVKQLAWSLGRVASILLDVPTIRLYQDALFWKRRNDGPTPWHIDARMAPFDTVNMITFWIPLQFVPKDGTGLIFCSKSHADMALPYWNPPVREEDDDTTVSQWDRLEDRYPKRLVDYMPLRVGDVTVHSGWTLHCSNGNVADNKETASTSLIDDRMAIAITFVDGDAEIREDWQKVGDDEDRWSYEAWCKQVTPRSKFTHDLVPVVWPQ